MCTAIDSPLYTIKSCPSKHPQVPTARRRRVQFCDECGTGTSGEVVTAVHPVLHRASEMSDEEKQAIWWSKDDFRSFKEAIRRESTQGCESYKMVIFSVQQACERFDEPSAELMHDLKQWITTADSRRGTERLCIAEVRGLRTEGIRSTVQSVLWAQDCCSEMCWDCKAEFTRVISEIRTRGARSFARLLGDCDAHSALSEAMRGVRRSPQKVGFLKCIFQQKNASWNIPSV
ncbi:hypothetical protein MHU86_7670 [Fragilaria crotonensis]|nr:hypothetical protein MHU86_7670 [Fragilaria crotonensis]